MSIISTILILIIAFVVGMDGILDEWQVYQPIIACTLIGIATGHLVSGILLGGTLQMIMIGWMNVGAAVAPDIALPAVISALLVCGPVALTIKHGIALTIPVAVIGQLLNVAIRKSIVKVVHRADEAANEGNLSKMNRMHLISLSIQGLRVLIPTALVMVVNPVYIQWLFNQVPAGVTNGIAASIGMISAVGFAIIINMMADHTLWIWLGIGFLIAAFSNLGIFTLAVIGAFLTLLYLWLVNKHQRSKPENGGNDDMDDFDKELDDL
ncbi:mannose/fructose/sorbose family PTS transporter subunit IIC [Lentilactobacillus diolivorans]|uniref:mannose/fructose/sorbose family PTS transporter subunit IIC n=1 Tax=Lentilactobacillus diolivorans TaxID=179838 RepID=UPI0024685FE0|nr:mannose/fructose/sorbose family PTS transporter subunit IIC [Lentilactobacillus diolivorans]MDH5105741.1 mannose/fructose/sorbose family PTS transporter subunit IIC [Lentilactobacillus diolivorans]